MLADQDLTRIARRLRDLIEPVVGQVYFAPECHEAYVALGFGPSPRQRGSVALPDGPAYFTSRGSCLGQVPGQVVAAAFAVFNPIAVVPSVAFGWSLTDPPTIAAARTEGAIAQLRRLLGDLLREYRGDAHTAAWTSAGLDGTEIGLLTELWWGIPTRSYARTRAWSDEDLDAASDRLRSRGLLDDDGFTPAGRELRSAVEVATDLQMRPAVEALDADAGELFAILEPWGEVIRAGGGYPAGPGQLVRNGA